jgi:mono/diheme cytochrome c family protein
MQIKRWTSTLCAVLVIAVVAGFTLAGRTTIANAGQKAVPEIKTVPCNAIASVEGKENFAAYCAVCHGADARGGGPAAPAMKAAVPDLTTIAKRHDGKFDALAVQYVITSSATPAHGSPEMPVWGEAFRGDTPSGSREHTTLRIRNLVTYLESLQVK